MSVAGLVALRSRLVFLLTGTERISLFGAVFVVAVSILRTVASVCLFVGGVEQVSALC